MTGGILAEGNDGIVIWFSLNQVWNLLGVILQAVLPKKKCCQANPSKYTILDQCCVNTGWLFQCCFKVMCLEYRVKYMPALDHMKIVCTSSINKVLDIHALLYTTCSSCHNR